MSDPTHIIEALIQERMAVISYLLDKAQNYDGIHLLIQDIVSDLVQLRHVELFEAGEYDDLKTKVQQIMEAAVR